MMARMLIVFTALLFTVPPFGASAEPGKVTLMGWYSDKGCAEAKMKSEDITPNGTVCVKRCLDEGATPVFVDPKGRAMYEVKAPASVKDDVGYYLEVTGVVDEKAKTISIESAKRLGDVIQMCGRKK